MLERLKQRGMAAVLVTVFIMAMLAAAIVPVTAAEAAAAAVTINPVVGVYSVQIDANGSVGSVGVRQSGDGSSARFTVSVIDPFTLGGSACALTPGTVIATFTGTGPQFTSPRYATFNTTTCVKASDTASVGAIASLNNDNTITLGLSTGVVLLTRTGNGGSVASPTVIGDYSLNINGSLGAVRVQQSGSGATATSTVAVTDSFKLDGTSCELAPGTVIATFTGTGPQFTSPRYATFNTTTCVKASDTASVGAIASLNNDNTITLGLSTGVVLLTRTGNGGSVASPTVIGDYSLNINGSLGAVRVQQSGSGATATSTVAVTDSFKLDGTSCELAPGTVIATFTGTGPQFTSPRYATFNTTTCVKASDTASVGAIASLNNDNTITLGLSTGVVLLQPTPRVSIGNGWVVEGNSGTVALNLPVSLSNFSTSTATVHWATGSDATPTAGVDYQAASGTVTFLPGETQKTVTVTVYGDTVDEPGQGWSADWVAVALTNATNATLDANPWANVGFGLIVDDDAPPAITIGSAAVTEGNSGTVALNLPVRLSSPSESTVTVQWTTGSGDQPQAGVDYQAASGTITFLPGETQKTVTVMVYGDTVDEPGAVWGAEWMAVALSNATNGTLDADPWANLGFGLIVDDD